jgi:hypothetical protein
VDEVSGAIYLLGEKEKESQIARIKLDGIPLSL